MLSWVPLALLFVYFGRAPALATVWVPMYMIIEVVFAAGISLAIASIIITNASTWTMDVNASTYPGQ